MVMTDREIEAMLVCKCGGEAILYRKKIREGIWENITEPPITKGRCPECGEQMVRV